MSLAAPAVQYISQVFVATVTFQIKLTLPKERVYLAHGSSVQIQDWEASLVLPLMRMTMMGHGVEAEQGAHSQPGSREVAGLTQASISNPVVRTPF